MFQNRMKYRLFGWLLALEVLVVASLTVAGIFSAAGMAPVRRNNRELVRVLGLTDLAIWTEARYTRHPSQADVFSAFQDSPAALEHFPAGVLSPPALIPTPLPTSTDVAEYSDAENEPTS
jgi:hypothetical protein